MSDETGKLPPGSTGSTILDNPQVYALLISTINERVNAGVRKRNNSLRNWSIGILTIVVIILTAGGRVYVDSMVRETVAPAVKEAVAPAVEKAVAPAVAKAGDAIRFDSELAALNFRLLGLDPSEGFTPKEAEEIIWAIQSLASKGDERGLRNLAFAMDTAVKNFVEADRLDLAMRLETIAPDLFLSSATIIPTMIQASGFTLLGDAGAPTSWTDAAGSRRELYETYRTYARRAELTGYPELYLLYEMLLGHVEGRPEETIRNLIEDADGLSEQDAEHFVWVMIHLASEGVTMESTAESKRVASRVAEFLCEYREQSELLREVSQYAKPRC